ncbi:electron transporter [Luteitalea sp. TBR-22]|uniref:SCO family protein n=1 Tax=Luteitalea sp. TBR-22 TaxID=2802971 RepID=UPI001AF54A46|nr:SCO family protein [Luteitalea sp. TBR-22]BCS32344.1 electron transporter [Luteitalea sp. TBR-22]
MTTRRLLVLLLVLMTVTVVVARTRQGRAVASAGPGYPVRGVVTLARGDGTMTVAHEDIVGYMPAMTMPFRLAPGAPAVRPGDRVTFTLLVDDAALIARDVTVVGRDEAVASAARAGTSTVGRLREGDAVPAAALVDQAGAPFGADAWTGHRTAVTFIFTRCPQPNFCPLMVKRFQFLQRAIAADPALADVRLVAVSLDPAFDTPTVLQAYASAMQADPARWRFVTGAPEQVKVLMRAFAVHVETNGVLLDHTLATALVGPDGRVSEIWRGNGWEPDEVLTALQR